MHGNGYGGTPGGAPIGMGSPWGQQIQPSQAQGGAPWPAPPSAQAALSPSTFASYAQNPDVRWTRVQAYYPYLTLPNAAFIAIKPLDLVVSCSGNAANTSYANQQVTLPVPSVVFATTAACVDTTGTALPVGLSSLDCFTIDIVMSNNDKKMTAAALGSAVLGTAQRPRLIGPTGWMADMGQSFNLTITPLRSNLRIDVVLLAACIYGPASFSWQQIPTNNPLP